MVVVVKRCAIRLLDATTKGAHKANACRRDGLTLGTRGCDGAAMEWSKNGTIALKTRRTAKQLT